MDTPPSSTPHDMSDMSDMSDADVDGGRSIRGSSLFDASAPLASPTVVIGGSVALFGPDAFDGPVQVAPVLCSMIAVLGVSTLPYALDALFDAAGPSIDLTDGFTSFQVARADDIHPAGDAVGSILQEGITSP